MTSQVNESAQKVDRWVGAGNSWSCDAQVSTTHLHCHSQTEIWLDTVNKGTRPHVFNNAREWKPIPFPRFIRFMWYTAFPKNRGMAFLGGTKTGQKCPARKLEY